MHIARMLVRVIGERSWDDNDRSEALVAMERALKQLVANGELELEPLRDRRAQKVFSVDLNPVTIKTPEDGYQAKQGGSWPRKIPSLSAAASTRRGRQRTRRRTGALCVDLYRLLAVIFRHPGPG